MLFRNFQHGSTLQESRERESVIVCVLLNASIRRVSGMKHNIKFKSMTVCYPVWAIYAIVFASNSLLFVSYRDGIVLNRVVVAWEEV